MNVATLHQIWTAIENTHSHILLALSEPELVEHLLGELRGKTALGSEEIGVVSAYLHSRTSLIRDIAETRQA